MYQLVAIETLLFVKLLLSNGCRIVAVVALHQVYMSLLFFCDCRNSNANTFSPNPGELPSRKSCSERG
jgi:hypothetical protein